MATVGTRTVLTFSAPVRSSLPVDANMVRGNDNTLRVAFNAHDADTGIHVQSSTVANRPAAGTAGRLWLTTDANAVRFWYDTGAAWEEVGYLRLTSGTLYTVNGTALTNGAGALTGTLTNSPKAGNPTKWIPIDDNGTVRYIPAW